MVLARYFALNFQAFLGTALKSRLVELQTSYGSR